MSPAPLPANGGADDCMYKMPYTIPTLAFKSVAYGDIQYSKRGMKGSLKMPFMAAGAATYVSSVRLISDMSSSTSSSPSFALAWSAGSATVYHGQIQPSAAFAGGVSFASEVLAYLASCLRSVYNHNSLIQRQSKNDADSAGPGPWHVLGGGKEASSSSSSSSSVVRLLKAVERREHDEL